MDSSRREELKADSATSCTGCGSGFFGSLPVIGKVVLKVLPAASLVGIRVGVTAIVFAVVQIFRGRFWLKRKEDYWKLAVLSFFGVVLNQLLFITGLSLTKASTHPFSPLQFRYLP